LSVSGDREAQYPAPKTKVGNRTYMAWSTNDERRMHWAVRRKLVEAWRRWGYMVATNEEWEDLGPVVIEIAIPFERAARRDPMNYVGTVMKAVIDGMVDAGCWPDDTPEWVTITQPFLEIGDDATIRLTPRTPG
jgi:hypothetical protein